MKVFALLGDFSLSYQSLVQIDKGAFAAVSLGARISDSLLVVTKFLRKNNVRRMSEIYYYDVLFYSHHAKPVVCGCYCSVTAEFRISFFFNFIIGYNF